MELPIRVLHVDDEPGFADMVGSFLEREDDRIEVTSATSVEDGLRIVRQEEIDCVVSDYSMPERNGIEFLTAIREANPKLPFILYTGKGSEEIASDAISAGVTDYLQKERGSDHYTVLANRITNAVESRRSQRALSERNRQLHKYEQMINSMLEAACIYDEDGRFEIVNEYLADWYGTTRDALEGEPSTLISRIREQRTGNPFQELLDGEREQLRGTIESEFPGHGYAVLEYQLTPLTVAGTVEGVVGVTREITERNADNRKLREKERRYQAIFNDPNILVGLTDTDGTVLDINRTAMEYIDATLGEVTGRPLWETPWFDHSEPVQREVKDWIDRAADGEYVEFDVDIVRSADDFYTIEGVVRPVTDDDGEVVSLIISDRDVTERKRRTRELERTNALLSTLFETLPVGVLAEDASRNVLAVNQRLIELFELSVSPDEAVGTNCGELAADVRELFVDPERFTERIEGVVAAHETVDNEPLELRDGRTFVRSHRPIRLPNGEGHLWVYRDVTERENHERAIAALHEVATELAQCSSREPIYRRTIDAAESLLEFDRAAIAIEDDGRLRVTAMSDDLSLDDRPSMAVDEGIAGKTYRTGEPILVDDATTTPEAKPQPEDVHAAISVPIDDHGVFQVIDDRPNAFDEQDVELAKLLVRHTESALDLLARERELRRQNDRLEQFASVVSHDLRNPLTVAEGHLEHVRTEHDDERLEEIDWALDRMDTLIEELLTLARDGDQIGQLEPIDLAALTRNCWRNVATAEATLRADIDRSIQADRGRLRQLLENLIRNAIEHGGDDVTVTVGELDDGFSIEDDGSGIPEGDRESVFDTGYSTSESGTGFGLTIVEQVADAHDWDVTVSESETGGARFEISGVEMVQ